MKSRLLGAICTYAFALSIATLVYGSPDPTEQCSVGTLIEPHSGKCAPVNDLRAFTTKDLTSRADELPSLKELRQQKLEKLEQSTRANEIQSVPPPGGIGAGTVYKQGSLQALEHAELHTKMFVHPDGVDPSSSGLSWLFSAATNRTEKGVEVVGIYFEENPDGSLGVFDWSCSPEYPCEGGETGASWIWTSFFTDFPCTITELVDKGGHLQTVIQYANQTRKIDNGSPPLWRNAVYLWNTCEKKWDLVYDHEYRIDQRDCSLRSECGWWGPIMETFSESLPEIDEVGYEDSLLFHDGVWSELRPDETDFVYPDFPWLLFHLDANRGYGVGNRVVVMTSVIIDIKPGNERNVINPRSKGGVWVAILSDTHTGSPFDPSSQVDVPTVEFGPDGAKAIRHKVKDINKDGLGDLLLRFSIPETGVACGDTEATLTGLTFEGVSFTGSDSIKTVGCKPNKCHKKHHHEKHNREYHDDDCDDDEKHYGRHKEEEHHERHYRQHDDNDRDDDHKKR